VQCADRSTGCVHVNKTINHTRLGRHAAWSVPCLPDTAAAAAVTILSAEQIVRILLSILPVAAATGSTRLLFAGLTNDYLLTVFDTLATAAIFLLLRLYFLYCHTNYGMLRYIADLQLTAVASYPELDTSLTL